MLINITTTMQFDEAAPVITMDKQLLEFIKVILATGSKVDAIKLLRYVYKLQTKENLGLKYAKDIVDYIQSNPEFKIITHCNNYY